MSNKVNIGKALNIAGATTTLVKTGNGVLYRIVVNTTAAGQIHVYDGIDASGTLIGTIKASVVEGFFEFLCGFLTGLCIVTDAASDITVVYE